MLKSVSGMVTVALTVGCAAHWSERRVASDVLAAPRVPNGAPVVPVIVPMAPTGSHQSTISGPCPSPSMSCYPGCATVGESFACGNQLVLLAGGLAAALLYIAAAESLTLPDFCNKYGTLCAKAHSKAEPKRYADQEPCLFLGAGGDPMWRKGLTCKYRCKDDVLEMQLDPPESKCPGDDGSLVDWGKIKWLDIKKIL